MNTFSIGNTQIDLPPFLKTRDDDATLVAYPPKTDFANLRFTVITVSKNGNYVSGAGIGIVRERAEKGQFTLHESDDKIWYYTSQPSSEGSPDSTIHYWYVGLDAHVLIVSCFIDAAEETNPLTKQVWESVIPTITSFRAAQ